MHVLEMLSRFQENEWLMPIDLLLEFLDCQSPSPLQPVSLSEPFVGSR